MKRFEISDLLTKSDIPLRSEVFSFLDFALLSKLRVKMIIEGVLDEQLFIMPKKLYAGEAEIYFLDPLNQMCEALSRYKGEIKPGVVTKDFFDKAFLHGTVADIMAVGTSKVALDAYASAMLENSPIMKLPLQRELDRKSSDLDLINEKLSREGKTEGDPRPLKLSDYLTALQALDMWSSDITELRQNLPGTIVPAPPQTVLDKANAIFSITGKGKGAPLFYSQYAAQAAKITNIMFTIKALTEPAYWPAEWEMNAQPCYVDAYALAIALLLYLQYLEDDGAYYDQVFPAMQMSTAQVMLEHHRSVAKRVAWQYAAITSASTMADAITSVKLLRSVLDITKPMMDVRTSDVQDMELELAYVEEKIGSISFSPVKAHVESTMKVYSQLANGNTILPIYVKRALNIAFPAIPPIDVPSGEMVPNKNQIARSQVPKDIWPYLLKRTSLLVKHLKEHSENAVAKLEHYFSSQASDSYRPDSLAIKSDLLEGLYQIHNLRDPHYPNPLEIELIPTSLPKYQYMRNSRVPEWKYQKYLWKTVSMSAIRRDMWLNESKGQFVWPRKNVALPIKGLIPSKFTWSMIPFNYVSHAWSTSIANKAEEVYQYFVQSSPEPWLYPNPFSEWADMHELEPTNSDLMVDALSSMFLIYRKDRYSKNWEVLRGRYPVYGAPYDLILSVNEPSTSKEMDKWDKALKDGPVEGTVISGGALFPTDRTILVTSSQEKATYAFVLHESVPLPAPQMALSQHVTEGFLINLPFSRTIVSALFKEGVTKSGRFVKNRAGLTEKVRLADLLTEIAKSGADMDEVVRREMKMLGGINFFRKVTGWSPLWSRFPHWTFRYQESLSEALPFMTSDAFVDLFTETRFSDGIFAGHMMVETRLDQDLVAFEMSDWLGFPTQLDDFAPGFASATELSLVAQDAIKVRERPAPPVVTTDPERPVPVKGEEDEAPIVSSSDPNNKTKQPPKKRGKAVLDPENPEVIIGDPKEKDDKDDPDKEV